MLLNILFIKFIYYTFVLYLKSNYMTKKRRGGAKFTYDQVVDIKRMIKMGYKSSAIMLKFTKENCNRVDISNIRTGKYYKDVECYDN